MYITESMTYDKNTNKVELVLIWKTPDNSFNADAVRYRNNKEIARLVKINLDILGGEII